MTALPPGLALRLEEIARDLHLRLARDVPLGRCTSAGVGGPVPFLLAPTDPSRLEEALRALAETGLEVRILGNGTNVLAGDEPAPWVVVRLGGSGGEPRIEGSTVRVPAGTSLPHLVRETVRAGLRGLEHAEGIPGTVGGSVRGNAGCFGGDMAGVARKARILCGGRVEDRLLDPDQFGYRTSPVLGDETILEVELALTPDDPAALRAESAAYRARRLASQPVGQRSAGCVFRNPEGDSAGRLIDAAGLKGTRVGRAVVSDVHANFFVNEGGAAAADFLALIDLVGDTVSRTFGVDLAPEVEIWRATGTAEGGVQ